ncbi:hypothetical protein ABIC12_004666, partial [Pantoea agglomerans]
SEGTAQRREDRQPLRGTRLRYHLSLN